MGTVVIIVIEKVRTILTVISNSRNSHNRNSNDNSRIRVEAEAEAASEVAQFR